MAATQNYSLPLPQLGEPADIRVLDQGTEMIDGIMHGNRTMVAPAWVSTETYNTGNRVVYLGEYYKCKEDGVTGTWDATKWDKTTVGEDIEGLGTGGASALADLDDVAITSPTDGQALLYDDSDDKWKNGTLPDPSVTKTATGNPIEITDAAAAPMVKCVTEIQGSQDLHGYDRPWVGGAGKNKLEVTKYNSEFPKTTGGITYTKNSDGSITLNGTCTGTSLIDIIPISSAYTLPQGRYIISDNWDKDATGYGVWVTLKNGSTTVVQDIGTTYGIGVVETEFDTSSYTYDRIIVGIYIPDGKTFNNYTIYPMIRLSTESDPTFQPYSNICPITAYTEGEIKVSDGDGNVTTHTTTFPSAIYRGSEDVVNGEVTTQKKRVDFSSLTWNLYGANLFYTDLADKKNAESADTTDDILCSNYETAPGNDVVILNKDYSIGGSVSNGRIFVRDSRCSNVTEFNAANTSSQLVYVLAAPTTSSVTPTNLPIKSISGYNHIESSTGEMEVEYISGNYQALVDLIQSNQHVYSTAEQVVGKWTDGKNVYEKTVVSELALTGSWQNYFPTSEIDTIISVDARCTRDGEEASIAFSNYEVICWLNRNNYIKVATPTNSNDWKILSMTVRYTKTTSNRSLSAPLTSQKAQIEPLDEKEEETPVEEEKAVEMPETEEENDER